MMITDLCVASATNFGLDIENFKDDDADSQDSFYQMIRDKKTKKHEEKKFELSEEKDEHSYETIF